jgi:DNA-directed RNA polymerase subunit RPC12/RpoP
MWREWALDKSTGHICPRCGFPFLAVYSEDGTDTDLGARCEKCGLKGYFVNGKLTVLAT